MRRLAGLVLLPWTLCAASITSDALVPGGSVTFDGLKSGEQVLEYYAGGFGSEGSGPGPSFGISFTNGLAADSTVIAFGPSGLVTAPSLTMTLSAPWSGGVSFYFTGSGQISFYSGPDATGTLLATDALIYPPFFPFGGNPGSFESAVFLPSGTGPLRLDSISFGATVIPEPSVGVMVAIGMMLVVGLKRPTRQPS
ncbi:MAG TPA: hypothetical protein VFB14_02460 [Bryobacteraceae bacterium]|nr:hypothetical protein [Bryobacteraceae bacterium]